GVVENQVRSLFRLHLLISLLRERANDFLRVMHIRLAAERLQIKGLWMRRSHCFPRRIKNLKIRHNSSDYIAPPFFAIVSTFPCEYGYLKAVLIADHNHLRTFFAEPIDTMQLPTLDDLHRATEVV